MREVGGQTRALLYVMAVGRALLDAPEMLAHRIR
jgi:hypothetical protein